MLIYFAHPIDQADTSLNQRTGDIHVMLSRCGVSVFRPGYAFTLMLTSGADLYQSLLPRVDRINRFALDAADALAAWLPMGVPTLGVPAEVEYALSANKPTLILTDARLILGSVQVASWRERGAVVLPWSSDLADAWIDRPTNLHDLLRTPPADELMLREGIDPRSASVDDLQVQLDPAAKEPGRAYQDDAGLDLAIIEECVLPVGGYKLVRTGVRAAVPSGWWGMITGRSSTWAKYRCDVRMAVIDAGYRGELMIGIENRGSSSIRFEAGTRLAQYVLIPTFPGRVQQVDKLPAAHRGESGYGSSGE
jgi:dUTP pyrophosphatase